MGSCPTGWLWHLLVGSILLSRDGIDLPMKPDSYGYSSACFIFTTFVYQLGGATLLQSISVSAPTSPEQVSRL